MIKTNSENTVLYKEKNSNISIIIAALLIFVLLLMRDTYSIAINKYIFLFVVGLCTVCMKINNLIYLFCFLFPLYVGLPGNYLTLLLIIRLVFSVRIFNASSLMLSMAVAVCIFIQNILTGYTGIVPMILIAGVILVLMLFTCNKEILDPLPMILMYSAGVAALGLIMLLSTLQVYELIDLMSTSFRLGSSSVKYVEDEIMNVSVDPNFYGMFSIASISLAFPLILNSRTKSGVKICLIIFVLTSLIVCLIGLSRAFVLIFAVWMILYFLSQNNIKGSIVVLISIAVLVGILIKFMPNVIETVLARFEDSDMATGNGRIRLINEFFNKWSANVVTMLFGVGLFNCNVHCMPLQFLFGGGLVMFILVFALFISYRPSKTHKIKFSDLLPFIVTFMAMCTVPSATLINYFFPIVLIGLCMQNEKKLD